MSIREHPAIGDRSAQRDETDISEVPPRQNAVDEWELDEVSDVGGNWLMSLSRFWFPECGRRELPFLPGLLQGNAPPFEVVEHD